MARFLKIMLWLSITAVALSLGLAGALVYMWSSNMPFIDSLKDYRPPVITEVYSASGEVVGRFWEEKRIVVPLDKLPGHLIKSFVAAEDDRFFEHRGIDLISIVRAFFKNLSAGKIEQGGSTITQQVTRSLLLHDSRRTYRRKVREALLSIQIDKKFSKERILFLYLNQIYLGEGAYGVEAAARVYFDKSAAELNLSESAMLAGLPQAPARYSPFKNPEKARARQHYVLQRMYDEEYIDYQEYQQAMNTLLQLKRGLENPFERAPYYTEHVRRYLLEKYGKAMLYKGGLRIYTHLDLDMQRAAVEAVRRGISELDKREGYRGPLAHISEEEIPAFTEAEWGKHLLPPPVEGDMVRGLVEEVDDKKAEVVVRIGDRKGILPLSEMSWATRPDPDTPYHARSLKNPSGALKRGDVILVTILDAAEPPYTWKLSLAQEAEVQAALICMESETGKVRAMVGGRDYGESEFNRAVQSRRQPGSVFKPIIYAAALDQGMGPGDILIDAPYVSGQDPSEEIWKPKNYKEEFFGPTLFRTALAKSKNVITVKILKTIGIPYAIEYARRMGIESHLNPDLSLALGSSGLSLIELSRAYGIFANRGIMVEPSFIDHIEERSGRVIEETPLITSRVLTEETAYLMTDLLKAVIQEGTGWRIKDLKRPAAGKTGTTNDLRDAWFLGYTPKLVTGVWVGYDDRRPMGQGETGSRAASPIWLYFMEKVLEGEPVTEFPVPEGVVFARIDAENGLLAGPHSEKTVFQAFRRGEEPSRYSPRPGAPKQGQFTQFDMEDSLMSN